VTKQSSKDRARARNLWLFYRITPEEHALIKKYQQDHSIYRLLLGKRNSCDHDHTSGEIRGLLEWRLNKAYGLFEKVAGDNLPDVLRALATYHEHPPAELALGEKKFGLIGLAKRKKVMTYGPPVIKKGKEPRTNKPQ
jgi:hypothetical protein